MEVVIGLFAPTAFLRSANIHGATTQLWSARCQLKG